MVKNRIIYISSANKKLALKYAKNNSVLYPLIIANDYLDENLINNPNLRQQKLKKLVVCDLLIIPDNYSDNNEILFEIFIAQQLDIKVIYEENKNKFEYTFNLKSELKKDA